jgi:hypothetical protein
MTLMVPQSVVQAGTTPAPITPTASDTIAVTTAGTVGWILRVITAGTASNVSVVDPNLTLLGNSGTSAVLAAPATGVRMLLITKAAANSAGTVTVTSSSQTAMTYELYPY